MPPSLSLSPASAPALALALALAALALARPASAASTPGPFAYCDDLARLAALAAAGTPVAPGACLPAVPLAARQDVAIGDKSLQPSTASSCTSVRAAVAGACDPASVVVTISTNKMEPVDMVTGTYRIDFYINVMWRDDRYFVDTLSAQIALELTDWWPAPEMINLDQADSNDKLEFGAWAFSAQSGAFTWAKDEAHVKAAPANATWVMGVARAHAELSAEVDLHEFPFDAQTIEILLESTNWPSTQLVFLPAPSLVDGVLRDGVDWTDAVRGWDVTGISADVIEHYYPTFDQTYSRLAISVSLVRQSFFWTSRVVLGVVLFVLMSIFVLALPGEAGGERMLSVLTVFLGMVSWEFVLVLSSPQMGYNTRLDNFMGMSFLAVFIQFVWISIRRGYFKTLQFASGREGRKKSEVETEGFVGEKTLYLHHALQTHGAAAGAASLATLTTLSAAGTTSAPPLPPPPPPATEARPAAGGAGAVSVDVNAGTFSVQNPSHAKDAAPATKSVADKALDVVAAEAAAELAEHHLIATAAKYRLNNGDKASVADLILAATAAAAADSALVAARDHKDYELVEETNSLQKIFCPREKDKVTGKEKESRRWIFWGLKCCWRGTWANVTPHRKLDFLFAACMSFVYILATISCFYAPRSLYTSVNKPVTN